MPPIEKAHPLPQNPFMAILIQTQSRGWPERDLGVMGELCHVGAHFEALDESVLTAPSVSSCIFFTILTLPSERCAQPQHWFLKAMFSKMLINKFCLFPNNFACNNMLTSHLHKAGHISIVGQKAFHFVWCHLV